MTTIYRPTLKSFVGSLMYALSPAASAWLVLFLLEHRSHIGIVVASGVMFVFSAVLVVQTVFVHLTSLEISDHGVSVRSPLAHLFLARKGILRATLRERNNAVSRTDRLLIVEARDGSISYPISVLSQSDEQAVMATVVATLPVSRVRDRASI